MITNINKKVICVKDIPSNIIEEAIFILKPDAYKSNKYLQTRQNIAQKEAEEFTKDYIIGLKNTYNNEVKKKIKLKNIKIALVFLILAIVMGVYSLFKILF